MAKCFVSTDMVCLVSDYGTITSMVLISFFSLTKNGNQLVQSCKVSTGNNHSVFI